MLEQKDIKVMLVGNGEQEDLWVERYVLYKDDDGWFHCIDSQEIHKNTIYNSGKITLYKFCKPIPEVKKRPMTDIEIFIALRAGAVLLSRGNQTVTNYWHSLFDADNYQISYDYIKGVEEPTWETLEVTDA